MFFLISREDVVELHPKFLGKNIKKEVLKTLRRKVEGKCTGRYGYTIVVAQITDMSEGKLHIDTGYCVFNVKYNALVLRTFLNEVIPCTVASIVSGGFWAQAGPLEIFVSSVSGMPADMKFIQGSNGVDMFYSELEQAKIEIGSAVRVKIVAQRFDVQKIVVVGSIAEDYLTNI